MTTYSWKNAKSGLWTKKTNWTPASGPPNNGGDSVLIDATGAPYTVTFSGASDAVALIELGAASATLDVASGVLGAGTLITVAGSAVDVAAGAALTGYGASTIAGAMDVNGGTVDISADVTLTATGALTVAAGGTFHSASGISIAAGAVATLESGASLETSALTLGGVIDVANGTGTIGFSNLAGAGTVLAQGGSAVIASSLAGATIGLDIGGGIIETTGALYYGSGIAVTFLGAGGSFIYDNSNDGHLTFDLSGMKIGGGTSIDLALSAGIGIAGGGSGVGTSGSVVLSNGDTLALTGIVGDGPWAMQASAAGSGTEFTLAPVCYAEGTRILTPDGPRCIETLGPGDLVLVAEQGTKRPRPVIWVGRRRVRPGHHPRPETVAPIRIRRNAIADGLPVRDLLVSPDHAILFGDVLIAARQLVNGASIVQDPAAGEVTYYHLELEQHAIVLAEGVPAETYLDTGNRDFFSGAPGVTALHPRDPAGLPPDRARGSCAPFVWDEERVRPVWHGLAARSARLGRSQALPPTTTDPGLHLRFSRGSQSPLVRDGGTHCFALPAEVTSVQLVSRAARPTETRPWLEDRRRLGTYVRGLRLLWGTECRDIPLDHPELTTGWWAVESGPHRWTDGAAMLGLPHRTRPAVLEVTIDPEAMIYPLTEAPARLKLAA